MDIQEMIKNREYFLMLEFTYHAAVSEENNDYGDAVDVMFAKILLNPAADDTPINAEPIEIGYVNLNFFNLNSAINNGNSPFWVVDSVTDLASVFYNKRSGDLKEKVKAQVGESLNHNIVLGEEFVIYPEYRCQGIGGQVLQWLTLHFSGKCGYFGFKSFPLQHEPKETAGRVGFREWQKLGSLEPNFRKAKEKLADFYKRCGFTEVEGGPNHFIMNLEPFV